MWIRCFYGRQELRFLPNPASKSPVWLATLGSKETRVWRERKANKFIEPKVRETEDLALTHKTEVINDDQCLFALLQISPLGHSKEPLVRTDGHGGHSMTLLRALNEFLGLLVNIVDHDVAARGIEDRVLIVIQHIGSYPAPYTKDVTRLSKNNGHIFVTRGKIRN